MNFIKQHLIECQKIIDKIDPEDILGMVSSLKDIKEKKGRIFFLGVGGSAGNCSHAVNDFRKILSIESYCPTDNVSELTARINDDGWDTVFLEWLKISKLSKTDAIFVMSVGGGNLEKNISPNLVKALEYGKKVGCKILGIIGRDGGYTSKVADSFVIIPTVSSASVTPHTEAFQAVIWHLIVSHPDLQPSLTKWESTEID
ncbi:MAG: SIS domain-containing protein [Gammaproteobacteria bacterium]|nr:SIS domain-containing protein [Gammaproteobacteria bacterium]